jgi:sodium-dependent phosphate cotransporter
MIDETSDSAAPPGGSSESHDEQDAPLPARGAQTSSWMMTCVRIAGVLFFLYLFLVSIKGMGSGLKTYAKDPANEARIHTLFAYADNPFVALAVGIFLTSVVQSSSFTTSFIIALVAAGTLDPRHAVPAIMGANIGTSVTNTLVSLAHVRHRREFRAAFSAATVHDIFNYLTVCLLLPLELLFGFLSAPATWMASVFNLPDDLKLGGGFISAITKPLINQHKHFLADVLNLDSNAVGMILALTGVILLFIALIMLVRMLKGLMLGRLEALFRRFFFSSTGVALVVGIIITIMVQSSSVTTSLIIPFVGAGVLTLRQVFPYMVGANIGTTCTGLLAAAAAPTGGSLMVAFVHLLFNLSGAAIFVPLRAIPISLSRKLARIVARNRYLALLYIAGMFIVLPVLCIYLFSLFR